MCDIPYNELKELPESKEEVTIPILIKGDYCSEKCPLLFIDDDSDYYYNKCDLFGEHIVMDYKGPDCNDLYIRCDSCKQRVPTKQ